MTRLVSVPRRRERGHLRTILLAAGVAVAMAVGCGRSETAAGTDQAGQDLRKAQSEVSTKGKAVVANEDDIERRKRELIHKQQELVDQEKALELNRQQLGSARGTMTQARAAYGAATTERFAKLDAGLAGLATQSDARSKDAAAGLHARRDVLQAKLAKMPVTDDPSWTGYTQDVDATFDAIERDLRAARP
jgi:hypothetical protein